MSAWTYAADAALAAGWQVPADQGEGHDRCPAHIVVASHQPVPEDAAIWYAAALVPPAPKCSVCGLRVHEHDAAAGEPCYRCGEDEDAAIHATACASTGGAR